MISSLNESLHLCFYEAAIEEAVCRRNFHYYVGKQDSVASYCCNFIYTKECKKQVMKKYCDENQQKSHEKILRENHAGLAKDRCLEYPDRSSCDNYFTLESVKFWSAIVILSASVILFLTLIYSSIKKCRRRRQRLNSAKNADLSA